MNKTQRIAYILKKAWELAYDIAVRTMTIEEAQNEAWMKVGGSVKVMIENEYMQHRKKSLEEIRRNYCSCEHDRMCSYCDMYEELLNIISPITTNNDNKIFIELKN